MTTNLEPISGIFFAMLILGERNSGLQGVGIAMVIAAIFAFEPGPGSDRSAEPAVAAVPTSPAPRLQT